MLEVRGLAVAYGAVRAVRGIDLDVGTGEIVGLLGPNGAGKTSTLRALSRLVPYDGSVTFDGTDLRRVPPEGVARLGLIHVPEGRHVFPTLTVHENLLVGMTACSGRERPFSMDDVYDLFPALGPLRRRPGWALSGGEQQMVAIGRGLVAAPRLLLLDEPSLGLAPVVVKTVFDVLAGVRERLPMLVVEQNTAAALRLCARASVMAEGAVVLQGTVAELGDRQALLDSFLGQTERTSR